MGVRGFFSKQEKQAQKAPKKAPRRRSPHEQFSKPLTCESCGAFKTPGIQSPKMDWTGKGKLKVLIIAERPGKTEDEEDEQLVGETGEIVRRALYRQHGIDLDEDCWKINSVNCWIKGNTDPSPFEIACCYAEKVGPAIEELQPDYIWLMGNAAVRSFYQGRNVHLDFSISQWRGRVIPDRKHGAWVLPMYHPSALLHSRGDEGLRALWERDLTRAVNVTRRGPPAEDRFRDPSKHVETITDFDRLVERLEWTLEHADVAAIDYETTGIKPHRDGHDIISVSIADSPDSAYSFPLGYPGHWTSKQRRAIEDLLADIWECGGVAKVCHNLKYEIHWTREILDAEPVNTPHCTMIGVHVLDNAVKKATSLKWQAFEHWGIEDYAWEFKNYASSYEEDTYGDNGFNNVHKMPLDPLLTYGGYDAIITYWLWEKQCRLMPEGSKLREAFDFFIEGVWAIADVEAHGVPVDVAYLKETHAELTGMIEEAQARIRSSAEVKTWDSKESKAFDPGNNHQIGKLLFTHLGHDPVKRTKTGIPAVDEEVLSAIGTEFTREVLEFRHRKKLRDYIIDFNRERHGDLIHATINLHIPDTFRSSADSPNLQNVPKRDPRMKRYTRRAFKAPEGWQFMEVDYGSFEVRGLGWYSRDKSLLAYLQDPAADMHKDQAASVFSAPVDLISKAIRFFIKNQWVFPLFYGSFAGACARNLWAKCMDLELEDGTKLRDYLRDTLGIRKLEETKNAKTGEKPRLDFLDQAKEREKAFWKQFSGVREWQDYLVEEYKQKGYIESYLGFRFGGHITRNKLYNYKIQSTAFHLLLWSLIRLNEIAKERKWKSRIIFQIHDCIIWLLHPDEREEVMAECKRVMTEEIKERFEWINTPLEVEPEISPVGGTFDDLKELGEEDDGGEYEEEA